MTQTNKRIVPNLLRPFLRKPSTKQQLSSIDVRPRHRHNPPTRRKLADALHLKESLYKKIFEDPLHNTEWTYLNGFYNLSEEEQAKIRKSKNPTL